MRVIPFAVALAVLALSAPLAAQTPVAVSPQAEAVAREAMMQLRSPVTSFHTLDMCPDPAAAALRDTVLMAAAQGASSAKIVEDVIARRGERLRLAPRQSGVGLWAWLAPPAVLLLGLGLVWGKLTRLRRVAGPETARGDAPLNDEENAALQAALREYDRAEGTA